MTSLVRDKIPQIIEAQGLRPIVYNAGSAEYYERLRDKLSEEVGEYLDAVDLQGELSELVDILEVVRALAAQLGFNPEALEAARLVKAFARGTFENRLVWIGNEAS